MAQRLIQELAWPLGVTSIPSQPLEVVRAGWKHACEAMSSSSSSIHFGHYMARMFNPSIAIQHTTGRYWYVFGLLT